LAPPSETSVIDPSRGVALGLCRPTAAQMAADRARKSGGRALLHNLTDLPPAKGYMAVYRTVEGCEDPLTMVEYRTGERR
jgi:hypothetical protein